MVGAVVGVPPPTRLTYLVYDTDEHCNIDSLHFPDIYSLTILPSWYRLNTSTRNTNTNPETPTMSEEERKRQEPMNTQKIVFDPNGFRIEISRPPGIRTATVPGDILVTIITALDKRGFRCVVGGNIDDEYEELTGLYLCFAPKEFAQ